MGLLVLTFAAMSAAALGLWLHAIRCGGACGDCPTALQCPSRRNDVVGGTP